MKLFREIEKSFPQLEMLFSEEAFEEFMKTGWNDLITYHFGFGTWIRNNLLYNGFVDLFREGGIKDRDSMSQFIIQCFYLYLHTNYTL